MHGELPPLVDEEGNPLLRDYLVKGEIVLLSSHVVIY